MVASDGARGLTVLGKAAWKYATWQLPVLPLRCQGKEPLIPRSSGGHGVHDATVDLERIVQWWTHWPDANVGIAIPSGWIVIDIDGPEGEGAIRATGEGLPTTAEVVTSRGRHLWYRSDRQRFKSRPAVFPKVDIRAEGAYMVVPPSVHPSGDVYRWVRPFSAITDPPSWIVDLAIPNAEANASPRPAEHWHNIAAGVHQGSRNTALASLSGHLLRRLEPHLAFHLLMAWSQHCCAPSMDLGEARRTIKSIAAKELGRRKGTKE